MVKTTVYLHDDSYRALKQVAALRREAPAALIRQAVDEFARHHTRRPRPASIGRFGSGLRDLGSHSEKYLKGMGEF